ncbi:signal peptide peptidase SppA [Candidatus Desantisbacteria bacterium]|nr:signal peptide peptidase SppA [Candidatus Desantisbacteria bacterium]
MGFFIISIILGLYIIFKPAADEKKSAVKLSLSSISKNISKKKGLAVLYVYGPITVEDNESLMSMGLKGSDEVVKKLNKIRKDPNIKGVVLRINSPGGSVAACQEIYEEIKKVKESGKKVVVSMGDVAASGGYYIACPADKIFANPGTITGSIGVIAQMGNIEGLFTKIGIKSEVIKSGKYKDIGSVTREMTEEERQILQNLIDNAYDQFTKAVSQGRKTSIEKVREWATGSIFSGEQALKMGMIDELGNLQDAIKLAGKLSNLGEDPEIVKDYDFFEKLFDVLDQRLDNKLSFKAMLDKPRLRLEYMMK